MHHDLSPSPKPTADNAPLVHVIVGTRPEAVKVAPMMTAMRRAGLNPLLIDTGQQPGRVAEAIAPFGLTPDIGLDIERRAGSLRELINLVSDAVDRLLDTQLPAAVLVQGDTTTAMAVALTAHLRQVPVVHLEAGLRTGDPRNPFPEETNRRLIADLADLHLAPTPRAARALALEGRDGHRVVVTGNTVVDALATLLPAARARTASAQDGRLMRHLVVTVHRREAWGEGVRTVAGSVRELLARYPDLRASVVTHPNPVVAADVESVLAGTDRCDLLPPQPYDDMLTLLCSADVVLTDSGGLQEEAPSIGVPAVVTRWTTERPEGVEAGWADLVGLDRAAILEAVSRRLDDPTRPDTGNPYGDGAAADRSAAAVRWLLGGGARPEDWAGPAMTSHADDLASTR